MPALPPRPVDRTATDKQSVQRPRSPHRQASAEKAEGPVVLTGGITTMMVMTGVSVVVLLLAVAVGMRFSTTTPGGSGLSVWPTRPSTESQEMHLERPSSEPHTAPPPRRAGVKPEGRSPDTAPSAYCYTLETYSDSFIATEKQKRKGIHLFRCGTRLMDLMHRDEIGDGAASALHGVCEGQTKSPTAFPHLRVVLTPQEVEWHTQQRDNAAAQHIPLKQLNDDYCDCLDGTDELLTSACSMAGPDMPLAGKRWNQYLVANRMMRLYESEEAPSAERLHKRLHELGGPVLPFACASDPSVMLAPSMVGDGIVDCCDGSDEALPQSHPYLQHAGIPDLSTPSANSTHQILLAAYAAEEQREMQQRRAALETHLRKSSDGVSYVDHLHPHYTSAGAMLTERGYTALFECEAVKRYRITSATVLYNIYREGNREYRARVALGWEKLGHDLVLNHSVITAKAHDLSQEVEGMRQHIGQRIQATRAKSPIEAGVSIEELQYFQERLEELEYLNQEMHYSAIASLHHIFGDHYEFYPLANQYLYLSANDVVNSMATTAEVVLRARARRVRSVREMTHIAAESDVHVDNVAMEWYGLYMARFLLGAQRYAKEEASLVAQRLGLIQPGEALTSEVFNRIANPFRKSPVLHMGHWQPHLTEHSVAKLSLVDAAGDVDLPRRMMIQPVTTLLGGGRLQYPTRIPEKPKVIRFIEEDSRARMKKASEGKSAEGDSVQLGILHNTPNIAAIHVFSGGLRCDPDPPRARPRRADNTNTKTHEQHTAPPEVEHRSVGRVVFVCDDSDRILVWARNGKCTHEIIVGTPSACTTWATKRAEARLLAATRSLSG